MAGRGTQRNNTQQEYLQSLLQDVAYAQSLPDADLDFLTNLQQLVLTKIREPMESALAAAGMAGGGAPPVGGAPSPGGLPGMPGGDPMGGMPGGMPGGGMPGGMPMPAPQGGGVPGLRNGIAMPPVDELRRMLGQ